MSNVLIGIIGVILFIGLALAGALFLGPRFQQSTNSSKGSAAVQAVSQVSSAANMQNVQTGTSTVSATTAAALVTGNYLKSIPSNPTGGAGVPVLIASDGTVDGTKTATAAILDLGTSSGVCLAIAQQSGQVASTATAAPVVASTGAMPTSPSGCVQVTAASSAAGVTANDYVAFATI